MKILLANLLLKYTQCSLNFEYDRISLVWTWRGNSLKWVLRERDGMLIIQTGVNTIKMVKVRPQEVDWKDNEKAKAHRFLRQ